VRAADTSGNLDPTRPWVNFQLTDLPPDDIDPDATVTSPLNNETFPMGTVNLNGDATDNAGIDRVRIAIKDKTTSLWWDGSAWQAGFLWIPGDTTLGTPGGTSTTWSYDFTPPAPGDFIFSVRADDTSGNLDPVTPWVSFSVA
jgi:hypothetical protein